jgi:hypothetical protein
MTEPTLQQVFGTNATQDATTITLTKADLVGLTASASNTAESIIAAIVLTAADNLTEENRAADTSGDRQCVIVDAGDQLFNDGVSDFQIRSFAFQFFKAYSLTSFDPDDY